MARGPERILDEYLVVASQAGSRAAFAALIERWSPRLLRFAVRTLGATEGAHDAVQETWAGAQASLLRLHDPATFPAWIFAIARRKCVDIIRARQRRNALADQLDKEGAAVAPAPDVAVSDHLDLVQALARLPPEQRVVVSLFYGEGLSVEEIAIATGAPVGTVKSRMHAARETLRMHMKGDAP